MLKKEILRKAKKVLLPAILVAMMVISTTGVYADEILLDIPQQEQPSQTDGTEPLDPPISEAPPIQSIPPQDLGQIEALEPPQGAPQMTTFNLMDSEEIIEQEKKITIEDVLGELTKSQLESYPISKQNNIEDVLYEAKARDGFKVHNLEGADTYYLLVHAEKNNHDVKAISCVQGKKQGGTWNFDSEGEVYIAGVVGITSESWTFYELETRGKGNQQDSGNGTDVFWVNGTSAPIDPEEPGEVSPPAIKTIGVTVNFHECDEDCTVTDGTCNTDKNLLEKSTLLQMKVPEKSSISEYVAEKGGLDQVPFYQNGSSQAIYLKDITDAFDYEDYKYSSHFDYVIGNETVIIDLHFKTGKVDTEEPGVVTPPEMNKISVVVNFHECDSNCTVSADGKCDTDKKTLGVASKVEMKVPSGSSISEYVAEKGGLDKVPLYTLGGNDEISLKSMADAFKYMEYKYSNHFDYVIGSEDVIIDLHFAISTGTTGGKDGTPQSKEKVVTIQEGGTPLANLPTQPSEEALDEILDEDVPLAALPTTGGLGTLGFAGIGGLIAAIGAGLRRKETK